MSARVREIIIDYTGTTRADLGHHVIQILMNSTPVPWDRPKSVAKDAESIAARLEKQATELRKLRELVDAAPEPIEDGGAVIQAVAVVERAIRVAERIQIAATERWEALAQHEGLTQESARPWQADMIALAAAFVFHNLTDSAPRRRGGGETRFSRMVSALYDHLGVRVTPAQRDEAIRRALKEFDRC